MASNNAIFTPDDNPTVVKARQEGKRVLDLRDDGKWHDISTSKKRHSGPGKGDADRTSDRDRYAENYDKIDWSK